MSDYISFTDKNGDKRRGVKTNCVVCAVEFVTRRDKVASTCSKSCHSKSKQKRLTATCSGCSSSFQRPTTKFSSSKSGLYFCTRACKDKAQKLGGCKEIQPPHYGKGNGKYSYRKLFSSTKELKCARCGYEEFSCSVDVHHIDHSRENNNQENLVALCANCHKSLHCGKWKYEDLKGS